MQFYFDFQGIIRLYDIPDNTFESEEESSDEESEEEKGMFVIPGVSTVEMLILR